MEEYKRFTVSLPKELYDKFEKFREKLGISRSDGIRKAMQCLMISEENIPKTLGNVVGCISIIMIHEHFQPSSEEQDQPEKNIHKHEHEHEHEHEHQYGSQPVYASVHQTDEILKNDIQHHFHDIIISTMHVHLEFEKCLEIIAVSGSYDRVIKLKEALQRLRSILSLGFFIIDKESS